MINENDMTSGKVSKSILSFFFPMLLTNLLQQVYSVADAAVVGRGIGDGALGAVGNISAISLLLIGFSMGLANGFSVVIAQRFGSGDICGLKKAVGQSVRLCIIIAAVLTLFSMIFTKDILRLMNTDASVMEDCLTYGRIIFGGLSVTAAYNLCSAVLRAAGDSRTPFLAIMISSAVNILLDIVLIFGFKTGVAGAAAATVSAQLISSAICMHRICTTDILRLDKKDLGHNSENCLLLLKNGLPMAFMNSFTAVGCMLIQSYINRLGADHTAAYSVCAKYLNLFMLPSITAGFAVSAFTGQNFGAGRTDRIRAGVRTGLFIVFTSYILLGGVMLLFSQELAEFMLSGENAVMFTEAYLHVLSFTLIGVSCIFIFRNAVQGMGFPTIPMISGIAETILRPAALYLLIPKYGFISVAYADAAAWAGALTLNIAAYLVLIRRMK